MDKYFIYKATFVYKFKNTDQVLENEILYTVLSKRELEDAYYKAYNEDKKALDGETYKFYILEYSILPESKVLLDILTEEQEEELFNLILEKSLVEKEVFDKLEELYWLSQADELKSDTFSCDVCRERRLQYSRTCPYEGTKVDDFVFVVGGREYTYCPVYDLNENKDLINTAFKAYLLFDKGTLPEKGGFVDQTFFFTESVILMFALIKQKEEQELQKLESKG